MESQRDSPRMPVDSSDTQSQSDAKSLFSQKTGLSQGRASSTNDPLSPAKIMRQLGAFEMDTASQSSSVVQSQSQRRFSRIGSRYQEDFLTRRSKVDPRARLEEFRQRYQFSRPITSRAPITTTTTTTTPPDFSFRHRRDWRHNNLEDFDDLLTIKSYSTDTNFSEFNRVTQSSVQPQASQQPPQQQQQPSAIRDDDEDIDEFEYRAPTPLASGFSVLDDDDDDDDDNGPPHSWHPPPNALFQQSLLKRRRLSHSNDEPDIIDDIGMQKDDTMIPPPLPNATEQQRRHSLSQQSKEELQHEKIPTQRTRFIASQRSQIHDAEIPHPQEQQPAGPSNDLVKDWLQSTHVVEKDKAITSSLQEQRQQPISQKVISDKDKASTSSLREQQQQQQSTQRQDIKGKGKADISQPLPVSPQREKEPSPMPNMDFEIDFDDMDYGGDDYNQQPSPSPQPPQPQPPRPSSVIDHGEHVASSSRENASSQEYEASVPEQRHLDPKALIQVHSDGRFGDQTLAATDDESLRGSTSLRNIRNLGQLGKIMFRKAAIRMSKEAEQRLSVISDTFYKQATDDLVAYAKHAKRHTISKEDAVMLLRRQERITDDTPVEELAHKYLPRELWDEFCVSALAYNELYPKEKTNL